MSGAKSLADRVVWRGSNINVNETTLNNLQFDHGQNFEPPFGDWGTDCGFIVWTPSNVTRTGINILGIIEGGAEIGSAGASARAVARAVHGFRSARSVF